MEGKKLKCIAVTVLLAVLAIPLGLTAQEQATMQGQKPSHHRYKFVDLGTFGGPHSSFNSGSSIINRSGTAVGGASTSTPDPLCLFDSPYCFIFHAGKYENGLFSDLGSLPGGANNSIANAINSSGVVVGSSGNGLIDPVTGLPAGVATVWENGRVIDLGTFGGSFSLAGAINDHNQVVGLAENNIPDPFNFGGLAGLPSPTQWRATLWQHGMMQDLGTLGDGTESGAGAINDRGQIVGASFTNSVVNPSTGFPTLAPFLWENGRMRNLGTLGGLSGAPSGLNNKGQVVGTSNLAGDQTAHPFLWERGWLRDLGTLGGSSGFANSVNENGEVIGISNTANDEAFDGFLWRNGVMTDLGSVAGDGCSNANGINSRGQVVGESFSCSVDSHHAFLWENGGPAIDLNIFVPPGSDLQLTEAQFIGEGGEIAGVALLANGDAHAFLLIPEENDEVSATSATEPTQPNAAPLMQSPTKVAQGPLTPEKLAALREQFAHRHRSFGLKSPK
jgi:probable HAF family extracellular repeat protein